MIRVHGTSVDIAGAGILLRGASGAGKSDLALRLIDGGARLVADDQVEISLEDGIPRMRPPAAIAGMMEVRGFGLVRLDHCPDSPCVLVIDLVAAQAVDRMPEASTTPLLGQDIPLLMLYPWEVSAPAKVRLAVQVATGSIMVSR